jgi:DNA mismatch repair protein MutL
MTLSEPVHFEKVSYPTFVQPYTPSLFQAPEPPKKTAKVIATFPGFIATERGSQDGINLIDQKAGHARIIFEKLASTQKVEVQTLLIPYTLEVTPVESALLEPHLEKLNGCGICIKPFGNRSYLIDALPSVFGNADIAAFLHDLISNLRDLHQEFKKLIAETASRTAVSRSRRLTMEEAQILVNQLLACEVPHQCPKGKPIVVEIPLSQLTAQFK